MVWYMPKSTTFFKCYILVTSTFIHRTWHDSLFYSSAGSLLYEVPLRLSRLTTSASSASSLLYEVPLRLSRLTTSAIGSTKASRSIPGVSMTAKILNMGTNGGGSGEQQ